MTRLTQASIVLLLLTLGACTPVSYDLPPVADSTDGQLRAGKFIWHDLISDDPEGSRRFYGELFGWEFESLALLGADYWVISHGGNPIGGMVAQASVPTRKDISQWVSVMSVPDAMEAARQTETAGGEVIREPVDIGRRGTITVLADGRGAVFAALATGGNDPVDRDGLPPVGDFLWHELWTDDVDGASQFFARLGGLSVEENTVAAPDGELAFNLLRGDKRVRAGVRDLPADDMPSLWMPYLRVRDLQSLNDVLARAPALGGRVLVPATARPRRGHVAVIAGPSGAPIALQTWADDEPLLEEI